MEGDPPAGQPQLFSIGSLLATKGRGRGGIKGVLFSAGAKRACCFKVRLGPLGIGRTRLLDASSVRLSGSSIVIQDRTVVQLPQDSFEFGDQGWVFGRDETRMGDVLDILVDSRLRIAEFTIKLRHELIVPDETLKVLPKEAQKSYIRRIPDVATFGNESFTIASLPATRVTRMKAESFFYEVHTDIPLEDLENAVFRALDAGRQEKGLVRTLFDELLASSGAGQ